MIAELRFQVIIEIDGVRQVLSFMEMSLNELHIWTVYPKPLDQVREDLYAIYGQGHSPDEAFHDLYTKQCKNPTNGIRPPMRGDI